MRKRSRFKFLGKRWLPFLLTVVIVAAAIGFAEWGVLAICGGLPDKLAFFLAFGVMGGLLAVLYPALLVYLGVVTAAEISTYPKAVRRLLAPFMKLRAGLRG